MSNEAPLDILFRAVDRVTAPARRIAQGINRQMAPLRRIRMQFQAMSEEAGIPELADGVRQVTRSVGRLASEALRAGRRFAMIGGLAVGGLVSLTNSVADAATGAQDLGNQIGMSATTIQELEFGAEAAGLEVGTLHRALEAGTRQLGEYAATGSGQAAAAIESLGLEVRNSEGELRDMGNMLPEIADSLSSVESESVRNALAQRIFGQSGQQVLRMLEEGSEGLASYAQQAQRTGGIIDDQAAGIAADYDAAMQEARWSLRGLRNTIGVELMPVVSDLADQMSAFTTENRDEIQDWSAAFADDLPGHLQDLAEAAQGVAAAVRPMASVVEWSTDNFGAFETGMAAVAFAVGARLIPAILGLIPAFWALGAAMLGTKIGLVITAMGALAGVVAWAIRDWEGFRDFWLGMWDSVVGEVEDASGRVASAFEQNAIYGIIALLAEHNPMEHLWRGFTFIIDKITGYDLYGAANDWADALGQGIKDNLAELRQWVAGWAEDISDMIPSMSDLTGGAADAWDSLSSRIPGMNRDEGANQAPLSGDMVRPESRDVNVGARVQFDNLPPGARPSAWRDDGGDVGMDLGWALMD